MFKLGLGNELVFMMRVVINTFSAHRLTNKLKFAHALLLFVSVGPHTMSWRKIGKCAFFFFYILKANSNCTDRRQRIRFVQSLC